MTTKYKAYDRGCTNADTSHYWTYYLESGLSEHLGIDLQAPAGTSVYAIADGLVRDYGYLWGSQWGKVAIVSHRSRENGWFTVAYGHVGNVNNPRTGSHWSKNDMVRRGERIGVTITMTGGPAHLHLGLTPKSVTTMPGSSESTTASCTHKALDTEDPLVFLPSKTRLNLVNNIVRWQNTDGSLVSWRVVSKDGSLVRNWIPNQTTYDCLVAAGARSWGPMPARFLDQLPDQTGVWASCP